LKSDVLILIRELSNETLGLFNNLQKGFDNESAPDIKTLSQEMQVHLDDTHKQLLSLLADSERRDVGSLTNFVTYSQRLKDKLINYAHMKA